MFFNILVICSFTLFLPGTYMHQEANVDIIEKKVDLVKIDKVLDSFLPYWCSGRPVLLQHNFGCIEGTVQTFWNGRR